MNDKTKEQVAALLKDRTQRDALAAMLTEYIQPQHLTNEFISDLLTTRSLNPGDSLVKKIRRGIDVRTLVPGSVHLASEITVEERISHVIDGLDVKVMYNMWELESGSLGTVQEIRNEMTAKLRDAFVNRVYSALSSVWSASNTPDNYTSVGGAITATALENAINRINQTTSGAKAIVGSRAAVTPITKFGAFWSDGTNVGVSENALDEIRNSGRLGRYYGVPIIAVEQRYDNPYDYNALVPSDKILVIGDRVGEFVTYGQARTKVWDDMNPTPPYTFIEMYQQFGLIIDNAQGIFVLGNIS